MNEPSGSDDFYHSCGTQIYQSDNYCPECGAALDDHGTQSAGRPPENQHPAPRDGTGSGSDWEKPSREPRRTGPGAPGSMRGKEPGWRPIATGIGLAVLSIILLLAFTLLSVPLVGLLQLSTGAALIVGAAFGQYFGFFGLAVGYLRRTRRFGWADIREYLGLRVPSLKELGVVILGYFGIIVLAIVVSTIIALLGTEPASNESANQLTQSAGTDPVLIAGVFALMFLVIGPCEEILYRGVIQNRIRERFDVVPGIVAASIIFASVHVVALGSTDPVAVATTISILSVTALVLGAVYEYTGNLVVPWLLHSLHNSILISLAFFGPQQAGSVLFAPVRFVIGLL
ncbi:CPBP family intramembrane metalloprotease [Halovenus sp. WSH3]|uniref:CPBP family intramembrane metalloprotease n=1 Tax=Halovenus carboxidivorans TaxID=2692199 RepID=A0A6B0TBF9_9EURY|nr:type II CAAX endopeptidase family protein [Halovenus carboxidivorans]MXR52240.1 CPBP family intramembrane metalloprotease [Halovenus carboxidivorans]